MRSRHGSAPWRALGLASLVLLLSLPAACGTGYGGGGRTLVRLGGGVLRPSKAAYEVTGDAAAVLPRGATNHLPAHVDLRDDGIIPPVQDQALNSCVGWALGYYVMTAVEAQRLRAGGWWLDMSDPENWFSPDFLYGQRDTEPERGEVITARARAGDPIEPICYEPDGDIGCMRPERALAALMEHGCCRWTWLRDEQGQRSLARMEGARGGPGPGSRSLWQFATEASGAFRPRCFVRFGALDDLRQDTVRRMRAWLHDQGTPIAIVVNQMSGWVRYRGETSVDVVTKNACGSGSVERRPMCLDAGGTDLGGQHMMTIIGYDAAFPTKEQYAGELDGCGGSFLVINQWGRKWGDRGTMWIPCAELARIWVGGYGILAGKDIVVGSASYRPLREFLCVQDDQGKYLQVSADGNDVPANLLTACDILSLDDTRAHDAANEPCGELLSATARAAWQDICDAEGDVPGLHSHLTACRLELPPAGTPAGVLHGPAEVAGKDATTGDVYDSADWYYVDVPDGVGPVRMEVRLEPWPPAADVPAHVELEVTDDLYVGIGIPLTSERGAAAVLCGPARYFVKVYSTQFGEPDGVTPGTPYGLRTILLDTVDPCEPEGPGEATPPACVVGHAVPLSMGGEAAQTQVLYHVTDVPADRDVRIVLSNVRGVTPRAQLSVSVFQTFHFIFGYRPPESWLRSVAATVVEIEGGDVTVSLSADLGRGAYMGGRNTRGVDLAGFPYFIQEERSDFDLVIGVRNLTSRALDCDLHVESCGIDADALIPTAAAVDPSGVGTRRFLLRSAAEGATYGRRDLQVCLRAFCEPPEIVLTDDAGNVLTDQEGFDVSLFVETPIRSTRRIRVPVDHTGNVWVQVVDPARAGGAPPTFALDLARKVALRVWPLVQAIDVPPDGNSTPGRAIQVALSDALAAPIEGSVAYYDWFDFYTLINDTDAPQDVTVEFVRTYGSYQYDPIVFGSHWPATPPANAQARVTSEFFCAPCQHAAMRTGDPTLDRIQFRLDPGAAQLIKLQFWEIALQFTIFEPAFYRLDVSATPP